MDLAPMHFPSRNDAGGYSFHDMSRTELRRIPGVGPAIEADLLAVGVRRVSDLEGRDPQELYARICAHQGMQVDRCMLYVMRCAVYFAETPDPDPDLLRWWAWKDRTHPREVEPEARRRK